MKLVLEVTGTLLSNHGDWFHETVTYFLEIKYLINLFKIITVY